MPSTSAVGVELFIVQKFARISDAAEIRINDWIARPTKLGHLVVLTRLKVTDQVLKLFFRSVMAACSYKPGPQGVKITMKATISAKIIANIPFTVRLTFIDEWLIFLTLAFWPYPLPFLRQAI